MSIEELELRVQELEHEIAEKTAEFEKVTAEHHEIITELKHQNEELTSVKHSLEAELHSCNDKIEDQNQEIRDLKEQIEKLSEGGSIPPTAEGIIHGIIGLPESEKFALAFLARTEQDGRDAFITMIYGKAPGASSAGDHGHDHHHSFSDNVA